MPLLLKIACLLYSILVVPIVFLYEKLVAEGFDEHTGTYRGSARTSLESRTISAICQTDGLQQLSLSPEKVASRLEILVPTVQKMFNGSIALSKYEFLLKCSKIFFYIWLSSSFSRRKWSYTALNFFSLPRGAYGSQVTSELDCSSAPARH